MKNKILANFFSAYIGSVEGTLLNMKYDEIEKYLYTDKCIICCAAATGINENEFIKYAIMLKKEKEIF